MTVLERTDDPLAVEDWPTWLAAILPGFCTYRMARHHEELWDWVWSIEPGVRPEAFIGAWARGGAKSTSAEAACVALGARGKRRYGLYVCDTQDRADDHVGNIASMLESERVEIFYPDLANRRVGKHGNSRGWRRNRLWTAEGFVMDAIGLDTAARGVKLENQRPDFIVIDDIDSQHDTPAATRKKVDTLTKAIIPAGAEDLAVLGIQNLILADGVFARLANGTADFLRRRQVSGPVPAVEGLVTRYDSDEQRDLIVGGVPTWEGQSLDRCQELLDDIGLSAFLQECQHDVADAVGALWCTDQLDATRVDDHPELDVCVVSVDPSGGKGKGHDEQGIIAAGRGVDGHGYVLEDATCSLSPMGWGKAAVRLAVDLNADRIIIEDNYGGEMSANTVRMAADALVVDGMEGAAKFGTTNPSTVKQISASGASKADRAKPVAGCYGEKEREETWPAAKVHHVGHLPLLEQEMRTWDPDAAGRSPNRVDALSHAITDLGVVPKRGKRRSIVMPEAA